MPAFKSYQTIVTGLPSAGAQTRPDAFYFNSELCMVISSTNVDIQGYKFNTGTNQWEVNTPLTTFDVASGADYFICVFEYNSELYMIGGKESVTTVKGWKFSVANQRWEDNTSIISGLSPSLTYNAPTVFTLGSDMYLIFGDNTGTFAGWKWNGSTWITDAGIIVGLSDVGTYSRPETFEYDSKLYLIYDGTHAWVWNSGTSQWDTSDIGTSLIGISTHRTTVFEYNGLYYAIKGAQTAGEYSGYRLESIAKITSITAESGLNIKAKLTVNLSEALESGDVLTAYNAPSAVGLGNALYLVTLTQLDAVTWEYQTDIAENTLCYFRGVQTWNGIQIDTADFSNTRYYILPAMSVTTINITDPLDYKVFSSPQLSYNHGSLFYNGYVYGSARNSPNLGAADIFKIEAADYTNFALQTIYQNKNTSTGRISRYDQIRLHKGFIWIQSTQYLVRINPTDLDYMVFSGVPPTSATACEPHAVDNDYIYTFSTDNAYKLDSELLIGSFASYGYDGSAPIALPVGTILSSCTIISHHPTSPALVHSSLVDLNYLYISCATSTFSGGYDSALGLQVTHLQKIRRSDMTTVNDILIPMSTDDITQNSDYIFLGVEVVGFGVPVESMGYTWGFYGVKKSTLEIKYLKGLIPANTNNTKECFGVFSLNNKVIAQQSSTKYSIVIDLAEIEQWGDNFPMGGATETIYQFQIDGVYLTAPCNELTLDNTGLAHMNTWEANTIQLKLPLSSLITEVKEPIIETVLISAGCNAATIIGYYVVEEGESTLTAGGFNYGTDPLNLNVNVPITPFTYEFETTLEGLSAGIYYIQAYGINTEGTFYGNIVMFSTYNVIKLSYDNALSEFDCISKLNGCSIRCVQDAPLVADGTIGTATDVDGNVYSTIVINEKRWFVENLRTTKYRDEISIPNVTDNTEWGEQEDGAFSAYNNISDTSVCFTTTEAPATTTTTTLEPVTTTTTVMVTTTSTTEAATTTTTDIATTTTSTEVVTTTTTEAANGELLTADTTIVKADSSLTITVDTVESTIRNEFDALNTKFTTLYNLI